MIEKRTLELLTCRAKSYRWVYDEREESQAIEAEPGVGWTRDKMVVSYEPTPKDRDHPERGAHARFLKLQQEYADRGGSWPDAYHAAVLQFASGYGLLGLFREYVSDPVPPPHADPLTSWVAPNATFDAQGRLCEIDPATEGKERLQDLFQERTSREIRLGTDRLILPHQLKFSSLVVGLPNVLSWEHVKDVYGVHAVFDKTAARGVSLVSTREPLHYWDEEVRHFPSPPCSAEDLAYRLEGVTPHPIPGPDGKPRPGLRCPSLLKAMYAMLYADATTDRELKKCQDPDCPEYFPVGKRSKARKFCPHPEDPRKQSRCGQRVTTQRERQKSDTTLTPPGTQSRATRSKP